jgi:3-deoxy-D-manno-octulosonic-acid transferase
MTTFGVSVYRFVTAALSPLAPMLLKRRILKGKEHLERNRERLGYASLPRPDGPLVWVHGASVGECLAALPLIAALHEAMTCAVLMTSGTVTSAKMLADRMPPGTLHQFVPIDTPGATKRFLDHWRPQAGLFVDSDIWPNLILNAHARGVKLALINARMTERSFRAWRRAKKTAAEIMSCYDACLAQDEEIGARFRALGTSNVQVIGSLKADAPPLPADVDKLAALQQAIAGRPVLLAAQTHHGEEETILPAHDVLVRRFPNLLTIIVPRHPERAGDIAMLCGARPNAVRSGGALPGAATQIYIADTMGELGLFYRLTRFCFVGGSLIRHGGQNPLEPARLGCAVLAGPHTYNFTTAFAVLLAAQGTGTVTTSGEIAALAGKLLAEPDETAKLGEAAKAAAAGLGGAVAKTVSVVEELLDARA